MDVIVLVETDIDAGDRQLELLFAHPTTAGATDAETLRNAWATLRADQHLVGNRLQSDGRVGPLQLVPADRICRLSMPDQYQGYQL